MPTLTAGTPVVVTLGSGQDISVEAPGGVTVSVSIGGTVRQVISGAGVVSDANGAAVTLTADGGNARYDVLSGRLAAGGVAPRLQIVGTRGKFPSQLETGTTETRHESKLTIAVPKAASNLRLVYTNRVSSNTGESDPYNGGTHAGLQLESSVLLPNGRMIVPTFNGLQRPTLDAGAGLVFSDPLGAMIESGANLVIRSGAIVPAGGSVAVAHYNGSNSVANLSKCKSASGTSQVYTSAAWTNNGGGVAGSPFMPVAVLGIPEQRHVAVFGWGDSIMTCVGDELSGDAYGGMAWLERSCHDVYGTGLHVPFFNGSRSGGQSSMYANGYSVARLAMLEFATHAIFGCGTNDLSNGVTLDTLKTNAQAMWAQARRMGVKAFHVTLLPKTTGSWASAGAQTHAAGFEPGGVRDQFNAWLLTQAAVGALDGVINVGGALEDAANPGKWRSDAGAMTADGTHPNSAGHIIMANVARAVIAGWAV